MTEHRVKAWAVVDGQGKLVVNMVGGLLVARTKAAATEIYWMGEGYRFVQVTIILEES